MTHQQTDTGHTGQQLWSEAKTKISNGTGLLSKWAERFDISSWPTYFSRCSGCEIWDLDGRRYIDFQGGIGSILLGYSDPDVNRAVEQRIEKGSMCSLVSPDEVALADLLLELNAWAGRVRYARGGGEAMTIAVRVARAATRRSGIAFCGYHGWHDWYLAANLGDEAALDGHLLPGLLPLGVPRELRGTAVGFAYNDLASFERALQSLDGNLAAVVMEPMRSQWPNEGFLETVAAKCRAAGAVLVVNEITSGWRYGFPGALATLKLEPDIAVYAKAMSNGFPCAAVVGKADLMDAANPSFISSTYWTDGVGPSAAIACIEKMARLKAQQTVWRRGEQLQERLRQLAAGHTRARLEVGGMPPSTVTSFDLGPLNVAARTVLIREMAARGFLVTGLFYLMAAHQDQHIESMLQAFDEALSSIEAHLEAGTLQQEAGDAPVHAGFGRLA